MERSALGECSPQKEDTKVETANEGGFFITNMHSEQVDGESKSIKLTLTKGFTVSLSFKDPAQLSEAYQNGLALVHHTTNMGPKRLIRQN